MLKVLHSRRSVVHLRRSFSNFIVPGNPDALKTIEDSPNKKILYFTASWCPPCKMIGPIYEKMSKDFPNVTFTKIDIDQFEEAAGKYSIRSVPTFMFVNGKSTLSTFSGADSNLLLKSIESLNNA